MMEWTVIGINWFSSFLVYLASVYYVKAVSDREILSKKIDYILLVIMSSIDVCAMQSDTFNWKDGLSFLVFLLILFRPSKGRFYKKLYLLFDVIGCVIWMFIIVSAGYCCIVEFQYMTAFEDSIYIVGMMIVAISLLLGLYLLVFQKKMEFSFRGSDRILLGIFITVLFIGTFVVNEEAGESIGNAGIIPYARVCNGMIVFMGIIFPLVVIYARMSLELQKKQYYSEQYIALELEHFQREYERQKEIRRFGHDIKNHLLYMNQLLEQEKTVEAEAYCKELLGNIPGREQVIITGDDVVDGILSYKYRIMKEWGIDFEITGVFDKQIPMKPVDICTIFANALDNAIEACQRMDKEQKSWITMKIKRTDYFYFVEIANSSLRQEKTGKTSKTDKKNHGFGLQNMKKTVEKYGGVMEVKEETDRFQTKLILKCE